MLLGCFCTYPCKVDLAYLVWHQIWVADVAVLWAKQGPYHEDIRDCEQIVIQ